MAHLDEMKVSVYLEHYEKQRTYEGTDTYYFSDCSMVLTLTTLQASVGQR